VAGGLFLSWFCVGEDATVHCLTSVTLNYVLLKTLGGQFAAVALSFTLNLSYLLAGYLLFDRPGDYRERSWTLPQCVICLKMIGLAVDLYDGQRPFDSLSQNERKSALHQCPSLLETLSLTLFPGTYNYGPVFGMRKMQDFMVVGREYANLPSPTPYAMSRLALGLAYIGAHCLAKSSFREEYFASPHVALENAGLAAGTFWLWLYAKTHICKYVGAFLVGEGACVVAGMGYAGVDERTREVKWDSMANVKPLELETGCATFQELIQTFNLMTNAWIMHYVYKRFKFLNSRLASRAISLAFLALWHGVEPGYYVIFANEFIVAGLERQWLEEAQGWPISPRVMRSQYGKPVVRVLGWLAYNAIMAHCYYPFAVLKWREISLTLRATNYFLYTFASIQGLSLLCFKSLSYFFRQ